MLNFSKIKVLSIYFIFLLIGFFALLNIQGDDSKLINKKINLGLDLQGGSYLLLEIQTDSLIEDRLQDKVIPLKKALKKNNIKFSSFLVSDKEILFDIDEKNSEKFELLFFSKKDNQFNSYIDKYNTFELDIKIEKNKAKVFSKYGVLTIDNAALKQSIEIVRERIDDVGTRTNYFTKRAKRILVELPGLKNPDRVKNY